MIGAVRTRSTSRGGNLVCGDERTRDLAEVLLSAHVPLVQTAWYHRWIRGDEEAWEQLVEVMGPVVYQFCFHFTQHRTTAEELTQEIFIKLLQNLPRLGHHTNLKCWLLRTAYHHCVDWHRRQKHERKFLQRWWREATTRFYTSVQEQLALQRDVQRVLRMLIKALPPELQHFFNSLNFTFSNKNSRPSSFV